MAHRPVVTPSPIPLEHQSFLSSIRCRARIRISRIEPVPTSAESFHFGSYSMVILAFLDFLWLFQRNHVQQLFQRRDISPALNRRTKAPSRPRAFTIDQAARTKNHTRRIYYLNQMKSKITITAIMDKAADSINFTKR